MKRQKNEDFDYFLSEIDDRKERKKEEYFKTKMLVPKITVKEKKRAPLPRRLTYLPSQRAASFVVCRAGRAENRDFSKPLGETH